MSALIRGLENLEAPCAGERVVTFCVVQKVTKKHTGLRPATSIQSSAGNTFGDTSDGTCRNRFFAQNGGEKALNRCEVWVLQRKDLERTSKEQPYSLRTVGYGWVRICGVFVCEKRHFSSSCKATDKEKLFLSIEKLQSSTAPKLTCNNPF